MKKNTYDKILRDVMTIADRMINEAFGKAVLTKAQADAIDSRFGSASELAEHLLDKIGTAVEFARNMPAGRGGRNSAESLGAVRKWLEDSLLKLR